MLGSASCWSMQSFNMLAAETSAFQRVGRCHSEQTYTVCPPNERCRMRMGNIWRGKKLAQTQGDALRSCIRDPQPERTAVQVQCCSPCWLRIYDT